MRRSSQTGRLAGRKGSFLLATLALVSFLTAWITVGYQRSLGAIIASERYVQKYQAEQLAESALDQKIVEILNSDADDIEASNLGEGTYSATVTDNGSYYTITTNGTVNGITRQIEANISTAGGGPFHYAIFGNEDVTVNNSAMTDSYDACTAAYDEDDAGEEGNIGTNASGNDKVELKNDSVINGNVYVGPDASDPEDVVNGEDDAVIAGSILPLSQEEDINPVSAPVDLTCSELSLANSESLTLYQALSPYCYTSVELKNSASIAVSGSVVVYVEDLQLKNSSAVNVGGTPSQLIFLVTGEDETKIHNSAGFVGAVYAPESQVTVDNGAEVFGSIIASEAELKNGTKIHFDTCLANANPLDEADEADIMSWRDLTQ